MTRCGNSVGYRPNARPRIEDEDEDDDEDDDEDEDDRAGDLGTRRYVVWLGSALQEREGRANWYL